ncbi:MAG TPA: SapB/AmfS family lanthipeptide [Solirubrobacteraceae bacterium]|nr:SapB/AmfS family lanthipeptide [Solirubrobacteraceae bacterium]
MSVLDLQGLELTQDFDGRRKKSNGGGGGGGGSNLTVSTCESASPSNLSVVLCH